jgi:hypothetical protein
LNLLGPHRVSSLLLVWLSKATRDLDDPAVPTDRDGVHNVPVPEERPEASPRPVVPKLEGLAMIAREKVKTDPRDPFAHMRTHTGRRHFALVLRRAWGEALLAKWASLTKKERKTDLVRSRTPQLEPDRAGRVQRDPDCQHWRRRGLVWTECDGHGQCGDRIMASIS